MSLWSRPTVRAVAALFFVCASPLHAGDGATQLTFDGHSQEPCWSPDGTRILHSASRGPSHLTHLWTIAAGGGSPDQITAGFSDGFLSPEYAPDGSWIVCTRLLPDGHLWMVSVEDGAATQFFDGGSGDAQPSFPAWSPDGSQIAFSAAPDGRRSIWVIPAEGGVATRVTSGPWDSENQPDWSPDGTRIVFVADRTGPGGGIAVVPSGGGPVTVLTDNPSLLSDHSPSWSPDGDRVVFVRYSMGSFDDLWIVPADGGPAERITDGPGHDYWPDWSPDGQTIAFTSDRSGNWEIWTVPAPLPISTGRTSWGSIRAAFR